MSRSPFKAAERLSLSRMQSEMSNMLERLWHRGIDTGPLDGQDFAPPIELAEEATHYTVMVELPGIDPTLLEVSSTDTHLTISGEKFEPTAPTGETETLPPTVLQSERRYGRFRRTITLPGSVKTDDIQARLKDGVLTVTLPKADGTSRNEVRVNVQRESQHAEPVSRDIPTI